MPIASISDDGKLVDFRIYQASRAGDEVCLEDITEDMQFVFGAS